MNHGFGRVLCAALLALSPAVSVAQELRVSMPAMGTLAAAASGPAGAVNAGRQDLVSVAISAPFVGLNLSGVDVPALLLRISQVPAAPEAARPALALILSAAPAAQLQGAQELAAVAAQTRQEADAVLSGGDTAGLARVNSLAILLDESRARRVSALALAQETAGRLESRANDSSIAAPATAVEDPARLAPHGETCEPGRTCPFAWLYGGRGDKSKIAEAPAAKLEGPEPPRASGWFIKQFKQMTRGMMGYITSAADSSAAKAAGMVLLHPLPFLKIYVVTKPDLVHRILGPDAKKYTRSKVGEMMLARSFGRSILTAEGEEHHGIRKELQGAFKRKPVRAHAPEVIELAERKVAQWKPGQTIDITTEMHELALHMFARSFFGIDPASPESGRILSAMRNLIEMMTRIFGSVPMPAWVPTQFNRDQKRIRGEVDAALYGLIDDRMARPSANPTLLDELIAAEPMTPKRKEYIRDQLTALFFAGHETSANLLAWTFHLVAEHPRVELKLREELRTVIGDRRLVPDDLDRLPYLKAVIMESMRLYPPGWLLDRAPVDDILVGGYKIPKGAQIFLPLFLLSRSDYFEGPDDFSPERFEDAKLEGKDAFIPFGEGIHYCLGSLFAMDSVQAAVATIMRRWSFSSVAHTTTGQLLHAKPSIQIRIGEAAPVPAPIDAVSTDEVRGFAAPVTRALAAYAGAAPIAQLGSPSLASFAAEGDAFAARAAADPEILRRLVEALRAGDPSIVPERLAAMPLPERLKRLEAAAAGAESRADADARAFLSNIGEEAISGKRADELLGPVDRMWFADNEYLSPEMRTRIGEVRARIRDIWDQRRLAENAFMTNIRQIISTDLLNETNTYVKTPEGWKIADFMPLPDYPTLEAAYTERLADIAAAPAGPWHRPVLRTMEKFLELESTRKILLEESGSDALVRLTGKVRAAQEAQRAPWTGADPEKLDAARERFRVYFDKGRLPKAEDFVAMAAFYDSLFTEKTSAATKWRIAAWLTKGNAREGFPTMDQYQNAWHTANYKLSGIGELGFFYMFPFMGLGALLAGSHFGMSHSFGNLLLMFFSPVLLGVLVVISHLRRADRKVAMIQSAKGDNAGFYADDLRQKDDFMNFWKKYHSEYKPVPTTGASLGMKGGLELRVASSPKNAIIAP
jgi:cytochrome P450